MNIYTSSFLTILLFIVSIILFKLIIFDCSTLVYVLISFKFSCRNKSALSIISFSFRRNFCIISSNALLISFLIVEVFSTKSFFLSSKLDWISDISLIFVLTFPSKSSTYVELFSINYGLDRLLPFLRLLDKLFLYLTHHDFYAIHAPHTLNKHT